MDVSPGDHVCFEWNGLFYKVKVPAGVLPGKRFTAVVNAHPASATKLQRPKPSSQDNHAPIRKKKRVTKPSDATGGSGASSSSSAPKLPSLVTDPRHLAAPLKWQMSRGALVYVV